jgi:hypothetical protein
MSRTNTYESRQRHYRYLTRPNGELLSEKDCLLLDLCIQWTKNNNIATSTYSYLLEEKFPKQNHPITVKRTFDNISLYIEAEFKNIHVINGAIHRDKIRIERASDFDLKMEEAKQKDQEKRSKKVIQQCRPSSTGMSTMVNWNVDPSTYIYKNTKKKIITDIIDNNDNQENQFLNSNFSFSENIDFVETNVEQVTEIEIVPSSPTNDIVQTEAKPQKQATIHQYNPLKDRVSFTDKRGNTYWGLPLAKFRYSKAMIEQIRLASKKPHFTHERIVGLFSYIAEKYPDKLILGGKAGFISYMTKVVNGEMEYTKEEKLESIEEKRRAELKEMEDMFNNGRIQWA